METLHPRRQDDDPGQAAMRSARMAMVVTDPKLHDNPIVFANDAFLALTGYARDEVVGRNCRFLQGAETSAEAVTTIRGAIAAGQDLTVDILNYRKTGEPFWNALYISPVLDQRGQLLYFFGALSDASARVRRQRDYDAMEAEWARRTQDLQRAMEVQQVLIQEIDHRVKNNLQMVSAMLTLQAMSIPDPEVRATLQEMLERVDALGLVHKRLYQLSQVSRFDVADFIREIVSDIVGASGRKDITVDLRLDPVVVRADAAASVGLIINEAVTNAVKHAFKHGRAGHLAVTLEQAGGICSIVVADDGAGLAGTTLGSQNFGTTLVETLVQQLHATVDRRQADPGTVFRVSFPIEPPTPEGRDAPAEG